MSRTVIIIVIVAAVVAVSVVFVVRSRKPEPRPATPHSVTETNRMPRLDTSPPKFPE
jgi:heme/copper-type cytochrome/quinol oxidase subunit 2